MLTTSEVESRVQELILNELRASEPREELAPNAPLLGSAIVDSVAFFELVALVEDEYGIELLGDQFQIADFDSISGIALKVKAKLDG